jgi:hypothetical protein
VLMRPAGRFEHPVVSGGIQVSTDNPSIERTCPGKPGHAAHVER